jgi:hypothetical protein
MTSSKRDPPPRAEEEVALTGKKEKRDPEFEK